MDDKKVLLDHGSGGKLSHMMINEMILPLFDNPFLSQLDDGAVLETGGARLAFSTDSYVVDPIFFPGGNIGDLAINGTINDIAMCGGEPSYISVALILEEGFPMDDLRKILETMKIAAQRAGVCVVTGDTKVLPRGKVDKIFINTSGVGLIDQGVNFSGSRARPGDKVILSGTMADHGITVLASRGGLGISPDIKTDSAPLNRMVKNLIKGVPLDSIHVLRDPTRGGVGTTLNEIASRSRVIIRIKEDSLPMRDSVRGTCELLGFDPLYIANEGKMLAIVHPDVALDALDIIRGDEYGRDAALIGEVVEPVGGRDSRPGKGGEFHGYVVMETIIGGSRIVDMLTGEQLPRIC
ncbi:MAG: hydrogenase expression/formation protein HypE [Desulfamplus sp.]|nr:hydrogenase expression/formation protein HypE [Desulfamplus sp.]